MLDHLRENGASIGIAKSGNVLRVDLREANIEWSQALLDFLVDSPALREIYLSRLPVTDDDVQSLCALGKLKVIDLENTQVTDRGLEYLISISSIEIINLRGTATTSATITALRKKLINTRIIGP